MKRIGLMVALAVLIACCAPAHAEQAAEEILRAVVKVRAIVPKDARSARTLGTEREGNGVLIDSKGHILTIGYLISDAETIEVIGPEDRPIRATFVGYDQNTGFGLLRADESLPVEPMKLGQSSEVKEGDPILVAGHGGKDSVQVGQVIARKEFVGYWEYLIDNAIYIAPPYPNFGGAALIDRDGRLLGIGSIYTQMAIPGLGAIPCNMFVPIDLLNPILSDLMTRGRPREAPRPWLGLNAEEAHGRVFVTRVTSEGPAEKAGLQPEDLILTVNGKIVNGLADFYRKVWALGNAGVDVTLGILRGTQIRDITVHSSDRYQSLRLKPT
ncbi:MAG: S1C family serine protease [Thermodesulfobacteriota bacterium]